MSAWVHRESWQPCTSGRLRGRGRRPGVDQGRIGRVKPKFHVRNSLCVGSSAKNLALVLFQRFD